MYNTFNNSDNDNPPFAWQYAQFPSPKRQYNAPPHPSQYSSYAQQPQHPQHQLSSFPAFNLVSLPDGSLLITSATFTSSTLAAANPGLIPLTPSDVLPGEGIISQHMLERCAQHAYSLGGWLEVLDAQGQNGDGEVVVQKWRWGEMGRCEVGGMGKGWPVVRYAVRGLPGDVVKGYQYQSQLQGVGMGRPTCGGVVRGNSRIFQKKKKETNIVYERTKGWVEEQIGRKPPVMVENEYVTNVMSSGVKREGRKKVVVNLPVSQTAAEEVLKPDTRVDKDELKQRVLKSDTIDWLAPNETFFEAATSRDTVAADKAVQDYAVREQTSASESTVKRPLSW